MQKGITKFAFYVYRAFASNYLHNKRKKSIEIVRNHQQKRLCIYGIVDFN